MTARAFGALLAFVAAILFTASLVSPKVWTNGPALWDGHPKVAGHEISRKDAHVGVFGAVGCDDHGCQPLEVESTIEMISFAELAVTALAIGFSIVLGLTALKMSERRKAIAGLVIGLSLFVACGAGALIYLGPGLKTTQTVEVPLGLGAFVFGGAVLASLVGSIFVLTTRPEPLLLKSHLPPPVEATRAPPVDVREILREQGDALRPAALGPEPVLGGRNVGGTTPLGGSLFDAAPQLKPLYEAQGQSSPPPPQLVMPTRPPTPIPRARVAAIAGLETPPPEVGKPPQPAIAKSGTIGGPPKSDGRPKPPSLPPPPPGSGERKKPPSLAPLPKPAQMMAAVGRQTPISGEKPIPDIPRDDKPQEIRSPQAPARLERPYRPSQPTISHAVPPPPTVEVLPAPGVPARATGRLDTDADDSLDEAMRETDAITAVEIDAEAKANAKAEPAGTTKRRPEGLQRELEVKQMLESADDGIGTTSLGSSPIVELDTAEQAALDADKAARPQSEPSDYTDENLPAGRPISATPVGPPPTEPMSQPSPVPLSTAPNSLPPPKVTTTMPSGPTPACPQCESPMAWVEEHLRFYCKSCRMYF